MAKRVSPLRAGKKQMVKGNSQVHVVSSGLKAKKATGSCGSCGQRRIKKRDN